MKNIYLVLALATLFFAPGSVSAMELKEAKAAGLVGEKTDGYLGAVSDAPSADVQALVKEINEKRKAAYKDVASKTKQDLGTVEKVAAEKAIGMTPSGQFVNSGSGWTKK